MIVSYLYCVIFNENGYFDIDGNFFSNLNEVNHNAFFFRYKS